MDFLRELAGRADLGSWQSWSTQQRVLAAIVCLVVVYLVIRLVVPAVLRLLRPALFVVIALIAVWALFPAETCSFEIVARLPFLCSR